MHLSRSSARRWQVTGVVAVAVALTGVGLGVASAGDRAAVRAAAPTVSCPAVAGELGAVPATARAEIERNLAQLNTQIAEANKRLATSAGEGGPDFVQNAILGPLKDKRVAAINRMATAIGRSAPKPDLDVQKLATCTLTGAGAAAPAPESTAVKTAPPETGTGGSGAAATVDCPAVSGLPSIPAQARDEVTRNLALLDTQIAEANKRLASSVGQGGPNFIRNAILGPLEDKRVATLNRIETAIGRNAAKPEGLERFAPCGLRG
ncbi:hypothetical protein [Couchioplanes caeruleus]|uniref:Secreted protein n=2 Tax=Couchioplanes caeruleus TaxID=56438 RepID=A0A1K0GY48_9ACTN|nr:hypothetical protein [Couchioplanes caeruleus]OJF14355.1 hypothetical protein BG844_10215 [Couchioplanes caeruleus subsp. caeruleus]ROP34138.1 hypothetical protein EDD30_7209 [Couchioplanes caeruleus]